MKAGLQLIKKRHQKEAAEAAAAAAAAAAHQLVDDAAGVVVTQRPPKRIKNCPPSSSAETLHIRQAREFEIVKKYHCRKNIGSSKYLQPMETLMEVSS
jgi:hypothetical protein